MERINAEKEADQEDAVMRHMFGGAAEDGQSDILEETGRRSRGSMISGMNRSIRGTSKRFIRT